MQMIRSESSRFIYAYIQRKKQDYRNSLLFKHIIYPNVNTKKKFVKMIHSFPTNIFFLSVNETKDEKAFIPF